MSFTNWFSGNTPLQMAINRGLMPEGNLIMELDKLDDYTVKSTGDAKAICKALQAAADGQLAQSKQGESPLYALARLFQDTEGGSDACDFLREHGIPLLLKLARKACDDPRFDQREMLFVLKMLAAYCTSEGTDFVIETAKSEFASNGYLWSVVLGMYAAEHPETKRMFVALSNPLPKAFLAVSLLDAANRFFLAGGKAQHPFDSDQGIEMLGLWLKDTDPKNFSYAVSATAALPFIKHQKRAALFQIAYSHLDPEVQLEAAWASAKLHNQDGLKKLTELCKSANYSVRAKAYLKELGAEDEVPAEAKTPDFQAMAEFAHWLAHPNELGRFPDELEILDQRELRWPTNGEAKNFWLIKYRVRDTSGLKTDDIDVGFVGNGVWCHFSYDLNQRHPEDAYAIHCYWELAGEKVVTDSEVDEGAREYDLLLNDWPGQPLENAKMVYVSELNPQLNYPRRLVGIATALSNGRKGWAVLDGSESRWYAEDDLPAEESAKSVLMLHIGRRLLGFNQEPDRKRFLKVPACLPPEQIVGAYEKLLSEAETAPTTRLKELIGSRGLVSNHFTAYVDAKCSISGGSKSQQLAETYERILHVVRKHPGDAGELLDNWAALGKNFEEYVGALVELKRQQEIVPLVELFIPHWQHNLGYGLLGSAAFKGGHDDIAEKFCLQLKSGLEEWQRSEEMSCLAQIWFRQGKADEARRLLVECMQKMLEKGCEASGSDRKFYEEHFQTHRKTFLALFPAEPLDSHGLPDTILR